MTHTREHETIIRMATRMGQGRIVCPYCSSERRPENRKEPVLSIKRDDAGIAYNCQHCGEKGQVRFGGRMNIALAAPAAKPVINRLDRAKAPGLEEVHYAWLQTERGISKDTADKFGLFSEYKFFPAANEKQNGVCFPYFDESGKIVSYKIRSIQSKAFTCWQSPPSFYGIDKMPIGGDFVIVEGELDVLAMAEAGISAVSVPNGAPVKVVDGKITPEEDHKFKFLWAAKEHIDRAKRVVIAVDDDAPGNALAEEIARRVGRDKCWRVIWPAGAKDANGCLLEHGKEALSSAVKLAEALPIAGLYDAMKFKDQVEELYNNGIGRGSSTGYENVDELYTIVPGQVTIVTGIPSSGKSEFIDQIAVNLAENEEWSFGICSFENEPRLHIAKLMAKRARKPFFKGMQARMDEYSFRAALDWVNDHFTFLQQEDGALSDLDSILSRLRVAVLRFGIRGAIIDPYNFIDRPRDISETEWVSYMLSKIKAFAMAHGIHIWFVAHPVKLQKGLDGKLPVPGGYDISGSAAWFAKADCGLTVHRQQDVNPLEAQIHIWKIRFSWVGKQGETRLYYDVGTTRYNYFGPDYIAPKAKDILD